MYGRVIPAPQDFEAGEEGTGGSAEIDDEDLILSGMNGVPQSRAQVGQLSVVQFAEEHAVLHVIAESCERFE